MTVRTQSDHVAYLKTTCESRRSLTVEARGPWAPSSLRRVPSAALLWQKPSGLQTPVLERSPPWSPPQFSLLRSRGNGCLASGHAGCAVPAAGAELGPWRASQERKRESRCSPGLWAACRTEGRARRGARTGEDAAPHRRQGPGLRTTG